MLNFQTKVFKINFFLLFFILSIWSQIVLSEESEEENTEGNTEEKTEEKTECSDDLKKRIRRQIAFKMSVISPAASDVVNQIIEKIPGVETKIPSFKVDISGLDFLYHSLERWPMAWYRTSVECHYDINGVTVGATYQRTPKIPFAGTAMWVIYFLNHTVNKFLKEKTKGAFKAELGSDFYGINIRFEWYRKILKTIDEKFEKLKELKEKIPSGVPDFAMSFVNGFYNSLDKNITKLKKLFPSLSSIENPLGSAATKVIYMLPEFMQVIPIKSSVFVSWQGGNVKDLEDNSKWEGTNWGFAKYHGGDSEWEYWLKQFVVYPNDWDDTSHDYLEKPK